jgi:hypothetical protein
MQTITKFDFFWEILRRVASQSNKTENDLAGRLSSLAWWESVRRITLKMGAISITIIVRTSKVRHQKAKFSDHLQAYLSMYKGFGGSFVEFEAGTIRAFQHTYKSTSKPILHLSE